MGKYNITIKNNETQETVFERDANAMVAGLTVGTDASSILLKGTHEEMLVAMNIVQNEFNRIYETEE